MGLGVGALGVLLSGTASPLRGWSRERVGDGAGREADL